MVFINNDLSPLLNDIIQKELYRQQNSIELIASENIASAGVLRAQGSILTNKYAEGYPSKRYYGGCRYVDEVENLAISVLKKLFRAKFANVQPHSGSQANQAVFLSLLSPGDKILSMSLDSGGHLTHGSKVNLSGKWFECHHYGVSKENYLIDYDNVRKLAKTLQPKLIIAGASAYPRKVDFKLFREIADECGAYLLADMAHISGVVAANQHQNPVDYAHVVTSTTHKTLRGPRGGIILTNYEDISKKINSAVFPGLQGGPLMHVIAAKAQAFIEASSESFVSYIATVLSNAKILAKKLQEGGCDVLTGGTDNHIVIIDLRNKGITGKLVEKSLEEVGITCNKNTIPFDTEKPFITSGIRLGSPAATTRGFEEAEFSEVADLILNTLEALSNNCFDNHFILKIKKRVGELCKKFPIYQDAF